MVFPKATIINNADFFSPNDTVIISTSYQVTDSNFINAFGIETIMKGKDTVWHGWFRDKNPYVTHVKKGDHVIGKIHSLGVGEYKITGALSSIDFNGNYVWRPFETEFIIK